MGVVNDIVQAKGMLMKKGAVLEATLIAAPNSTKSSERERDPESKRVKTCNQWYVGIRAHIGVNARSGLSLRVVVTRPPEPATLCRPGHCCKVRKKRPSLVAAARTRRSGLRLWDWPGTLP